MANDLTWVFRWSIESVVRIGGITAYMFYRQWRLALLAVAIVPMCAMANKLYGDWLQKNATKVQTALAQANDVAQESLSCVRTVFSFANEGKEVARYSERVAFHYSLNLKQVFMQSVYYMTVSTFLINTVVQASLLAYGAWLVMSSNVTDPPMTPQIMIAFVMYQGQLQEYCSNLFNSFTNLIKSSGEQHAYAHTYTYTHTHTQTHTHAHTYTHTYTHTHTHTLTHVQERVRRCFNS
jgi:ATP-binding cassette subfamily B (MDR/TAP) protein 9